MSFVRKQRLRNNHLTRNTSVQSSAYVILPSSSLSVDWSFGEKVFLHSPLTCSEVRRFNDYLFVQNQMRGVSD